MQDQRESGLGRGRKIYRAVGDVLNRSVRHAGQSGWVLEWSDVTIVTVSPPRAEPSRQQCRVSEFENAHPPSEGISGDMCSADN